MRVVKLKIMGNFTLRWTKKRKQKKYKEHAKLAWFNNVLVPPPLRLIFNCTNLKVILRARLFNYFPKHFKQKFDY